MMNNSKLEELLNTARINELLHKKELEEKNKNGIIIALAIIGAIAAVAAIAYAVYRYFTPDYLDDFDDDYEDDFDDDYIEFPTASRRLRTNQTTRRNRRQTMPNRNGSPFRFVFANI